jgi:hypothetical protein
LQFVELRQLKYEEAMSTSIKTAILNQSEEKVLKGAMSATLAGRSAASRQEDKKVSAIRLLWVD